MTKEEIIKKIKEYGTVGCTQIEHYIDYPDKLGGDWCQIIYWDDERGLAIYLVNDDGNGEFVEYDDFSYRKEIETFLSTL